MKQRKKVISATNKMIKKLNVLAEKKEDTRTKLAVTAKKLAVKAKDLAVTAEKKEDTRTKLAVKAKKLAVTAEKKEDTRGKLAVKAKDLAVTAKETVAENKEVVAENKEMVAEKKEMVAEKKEVVAENKVVVAENKELQSKDLAKDEFVSIASHQLRTPLTAINGFTGMLLKGDAGPVNDKQRQYLGEIKNGVDRMISMITGLLNVSRVDLGVFPVEPEPTSLQVVAESIRKELDSNFKSKNVVVKTSFEKDIPLINVDPQITRMVFENLLSNAMKYTPSGGTVNLGIKKSGPSVLVSVADTGLGIPEGAQPKIFEKMFRADNAQVKDPEGTGLGLYIIKETIEKTGGKIWFESKENQGSTFYVSLPLEGMKKRGGVRRLE